MNMSSKGLIYEFHYPYKVQYLEKKQRLSEILKWDGVETSISFLSYYNYFIKSPFQCQMPYLARISQC